MLQTLCSYSDPNHWKKQVQRKRRNGFIISDAKISKIDTAFIWTKAYILHLTIGNAFHKFLQQTVNIIVFEQLFVIPHFLRSTLFSDTNVIISAILSDVSIKTWWIPKIGDGGMSSRWWIICVALAGRVSKISLLHCTIMTLKTLKYKISPPPFPWLWWPWQRVSYYCCKNNFVNSNIHVE